MRELAVVGDDNYIEYSRVGNNPNFQELFSGVFLNVNTENLIG